MSDSITDVDQSTNDTTAVPVQETATAETQTATQPVTQTQEAPKESAPNAETQQQEGQGSGQIDSLLEGEEEPKTEGEESTKEEVKPSVLGAPEEGYKFATDNPTNVALGAFSEVAKELDLSEDSASLIMQRSMDGIQKQIAQQRAELVKQSMADATLGLTDASVKRDVRSAYARYFGDKPQLRAKLKAVNLDVDPEFIGVMKRIAGDMSEGTFVEGQRSAKPSQDDFRSLFPNTNMNR